MKKPRYSFIIPVYNVEAYLSRCLDSVFSQDYTSFEVICINDGSKDNSLAFLQEYQKKYPQMIIIDQENKGLGGARNTGVPYASGEYIWFLDSDDWIETKALSLLNNFIKEVNEEIDVILFDVYRVNEDNESFVMETIPNCNGGILKDGYYLDKLLNRHALYAAWNKIFKREQFQKSGYQFEKGFYEDVPLMKYYFEQNCSMAYFKFPLYNYLVRDSSIMKTIDVRVLDIFHQYKVVYDCLIVDKKYEFDLAAFFYKLMLDTIERINGVSDVEIHQKFKKLYVNYHKQFGYFTSYCLFNKKMQIKRRLKISFKLQLPHYLNKL